MVAAPEYNERFSQQLLWLHGSQERRVSGWKWFLVGTPEIDGLLVFYWVEDSVLPGTLLKITSGSVHLGLNAVDLSCEPVT